MFMKDFLETYINKKINQPDDFFDHNFSVTITPKHDEQNQIAIFSGDHGLFPFIVELPNNQHHVELDFVDIFLVANKQMRRGRKRQKLLKLIVKYLQSNNLMELYHD